MPNVTWVLRIEEFVHAVSTESLDAEQRAELEALLRENPAAREAFIEAMSMEAMLMSEFPRVVPLPDSVTSPNLLELGSSGTLWTRLSLGTLVTGLIAASLLLLSVWRFSGQENGAEAGEALLVDQIAVVTAHQGTGSSDSGSSDSGSSDSGSSDSGSSDSGASDSGSSDSGASDSGASGLVGTRLSLGTLDLPPGYTEILFDCGASISVEGPAQLTLENNYRVFLHFGSLAADVPKEADGFVVQTPTGLVRDLGTSFAVRVLDEGSSELHVLEGSVEATSLESYSQQSEIVYEQQAMLLGRHEASEIAFGGSQFRRPTITSNPPSSYVHWSFDTTSGSPFMDSTGRYLLQLQSLEALESPDIPELPEIDAPASRTGSSPGMFGEGLRLEGNGQFAVSDFLGVSGSSARTVAFWVRVPADADQGGNCFLSWGVAAPQKKWEMVWNRHAMSGQLGALRVGWGDGHVIGSTDLRDGLWHHVAVVFHGGSDVDLATHLKLYIDGRLETITGRRPQRVATSTKDDASIPVTIGRYIDIRANFPRAYFRGQFDELYIVEGALTPRQIVQIRDHNSLN